MDDKVRFVHVNYIDVDADTDTGENVSIRFNISDNPLGEKELIKWFNDMSLSRDQINWNYKN